MAEPSYVRARVVGAMPIRDAVTRESVTEGGIVRLLPRKTDGSRPPRCERHPSKGLTLAAEHTCTCGGTVIEALVQAGCIELISDSPKGEKAKS